MAAALSATRFDRWPRWAARALLAAVAVLVAYGAAVAPTAQAPGSSAAGPADAALYRAIAARVGDGEDYYRAATGEQRARGYPTRPFLTVRPPTLALVTGALGEAASIRLAQGLALATLALTVLRLRECAPARAAWFAAALLAALALGAVAQPVIALWHEYWSALLAALSLALRSPRRWGASVAVGLAAALFREFALAYLAVMAWAAWRDRRRGEAAAWAVAILACLAALALHAHLVDRQLLPGDPHSPGWSAAGGWRFVVAAATASTAFALPPAVFGAMLLPLALLGWCAPPHPYAARAALLLLALAGAFLLIGRPDNFYWGLMFAPLLPIGLAFAPAALAALWRAARQAPPQPA